jgi:hypothetical protein
LLASSHAKEYEMARKLIAEIEAKRAAENHAPLGDQSQPRGLPLKNASTYSGLTVCQLRTLVWNETLPAQLHGKRIVILREHLDEYLTESAKTHQYTKGTAAA